METPIPNAPVTQSPATEVKTMPGMPSPAAQSWGVIISIVIIVLMIVIGAFYAWGKRIAEEKALLTPPTAQESF
jgi:hypothetical protein